MAAVPPPPPPPPPPHALGMLAPLAIRSQTAATMAAVAWSWALQQGHAAAAAALPFAGPAAALGALPLLAGGAGAAGGAAGGGAHADIAALIAAGAAGPAGLAEAGGGGAVVSRHLWLGNVRAAVPPSSCSRPHWGAWG